MLTEIYIPLLAPTLNEVLKAAKNDWREYARLKRDYTRDCAIAALGSPSFTGKVWIGCEWYLKTKRRDPADNVVCALKFVLDALVDIGVITDDSGFVIQSPVIHTWIFSSSEGLKITISDQPIYSINRVA